MGAWIGELGTATSRGRVSSSWMHARRHARRRGATTAAACEEGMTAPVLPWVASQTTTAQPAQCCASRTSCAVACVCQLGGAGGSKEADLVSMGDVVVDQNSHDALTPKWLLLILKSGARLWLARDVECLLRNIVFHRTCRIGRRRRRRCGVQSAFCTHCRRCRDCPKGGQVVGTAGVTEPSAQPEPASQQRSAVLLRILWAWPEMGFCDTSTHPLASQLPFFDP